MTPQQLDRWLLNAVFNRSRIFKVELSACMDEFGNSFGGAHFFTRALAQGESFDDVFSFLKQYYAAHPIRSFNDVVGHRIEDPAGARYFCPWEAGRIRPLSKFAASHKIGPTPDAALRRIVDRLLATLANIRAGGFRQYSIVDGFPLVIPVVDRGQRRRYILRDGQHRAAVLSHLGHDTVKVCHAADHWTPSGPYRAAGFLVRRLAGRPAVSAAARPLREVREDAVDEWPHVRDGRVTRDDARTYFQAMFMASNRQC